MPRRKDQLNSQKNQPKRKSSSLPSRSFFAPRGGNRSAANAGLKVNELKAEITVETAIVKANCRKNCPVMPLMKAQGTNTADSTSPTATTGPDTSSMAL